MDRKLPESAGKILKSGASSGLSPPRLPMSPNRACCFPVMLAKEVARTVEHVNDLRIYGKSSPFREDLETSSKSLS